MSEEDISYTWFCLLFYYLHNFVDYASEKIIYATLNLIYYRFVLFSLKTSATYLFKAIYTFAIFILFLVIVLSFLKYLNIIQKLRNYEKFSLNHFAIFYF